MPRVNLVQGNFSAGETSQLLTGRVDYARYQHAAKTLENFLVLLTGAIQKRPGSRYVATTKSPSSATRLAPFIFRNVDALVLEIGASYIRFYSNGVRVESGGTPVEVSTPYAAADVFQLRLTQKNDVVYITHQSYAPRKLQRTSNTSWQLNTVVPNPPPTYEAGRMPSIVLTLGAVSGSAVTVTAASAAFLASDVDREIVSGAGRGIITGFTSTTVVTLRIVDTFASTTVASGAWTLTGSPNAQLKPSATGPPGTTMTLELRKEQSSAPDLVDNGDFSTNDLTDWANLSGPVIATGSHDGANNSATLEDSTADFLAAGAQTTQQVENLTDGSLASIAAITATRITAELAGGVEDDWDTGDDYTITGTGSASAASGAASLLGGTAGIGWIAQELTTVAGQSYRVTFTVGTAPLSCQVGAGGAGADLFAERSFEVGDAQEAIFTATSASSFVSFRNNQTTPATVDNIVCRLYGIDGWRSDDVGKYVYVNGGLVQITAFTSAQVVSGTVVQMLSTDEEAAAGAWTLESESWSAANGYPALCLFHEQRLLFLSSPEFPQTAWGSRSGDFETFTRGTLADDAFSYTLAAAEGLLHWAVSAEQLLIGAESGEFRMVGDVDGPLTATNPPLVRPIGDFGSAQIEPIRVGIAVLFAQRQGSKLRELLFTQAAQDYQAPDRSILSGHLLETGTITQMAYAKEPTPILWMVRSDGVLLGLTYERQEQILAWHRHTMGGSGLVESVCTIPHPTRNAWQTWLIVRRTVGAVTTRYVEYLDDTAIGVDSASVYSGVSTSTLTGLSHLNGEAVTLAGIPTTGTHWAALGTAVVSGGQVTLPVACTQAYGGLAYTATAEKLPPEIPTAPTTQLELKRWERIILRLYQTGEGLKVNGKPYHFRRGSVDAFDDGCPLFTGKTLPLVNLSWESEGVCVITHTTPLPCTVLLVGGKLDIGES